MAIRSGRDDGYIKVAPFSYSRILKVANQLAEIEVGNSVKLAAARYRAALRLSGLRPSRALQISIDESDLASEANKRRLAYRLAANRSLLRKGIPCPYSPVNFHRVGTYLLPSKMVEQEERFVFTCRILNGQLAGRSAKVGFTGKHLMHVFKIVHKNHCISFTMLSPLELMRLRLPVRLTWDGVRPEVDEVGMTTAAVKHNVRMTKARRRDTTACPQYRVINLSLIHI